MQAFRVGRGKKHDSEVEGTLSMRSVMRSVSFWMRPLVSRIRGHVRPSREFTRERNSKRRAGQPYYSEKEEEGEWEERESEIIS